MAEALETNSDPQEEQFKQNLIAARGVLKKAKAATKQIKESNKPPAKKAEALRAINYILEEQVLTPLEESKIFAAQNPKWAKNLDKTIDKVRGRIDFNETQAQGYDDLTSRLAELDALKGEFSPQELELLKQAKRTETDVGWSESYDLEQDFAPELKELTKKMKPEDKGILLDGDNQKLYLIEKTDEGFTFLKSFIVSTGRRGFANGNVGGRTPTGLHSINKTIPKGKLGSVIKGRGVRNKMVEGINKGNERNKSAHMVTLAMYLTGNPELDARGVAVHGTDWESLLGEPVSAACIRMANLDVLTLYEYVNEQNQKGTTHIYITDRPANQELAKN